MWCKEILFFCFLIKVSVISQNCGTVGQSSSFIVNGVSSKRGAWPWLASIHKVKGDQFFCGGNLIAPNVVLTAAHCIQDKNFSLPTQPKHPTEIVVKLGRFDISQRYERGGVDAFVNDIVIHPDWKPYEQRYNADLAILVLESKVQTTNLIVPVCLWSGLSTVNSGTVAGWGKSESAAAHENTPKELDVTLRTNEKCFLSDPRFASISSESTFCAGRDSTSGPCNGDSGSGLVMKIGVGTDARWYLRGLVSAGFIDRSSGSCDVTVDVIFTNVLKFLDWINQVTTSHGSTLPSPQPVTSTTKNKNEIFCFFESWAKGRDGEGSFKLENLKSELCTTLVYLHTELDGDKLKPINPYLELPTSGGENLFRRFTALKASHPGLRTLLAVGSWNEGSVKYSELAADPERRKRFADNAAKFVQKYGFDGLHFHWEHPAHRGGASEDKENFPSLLQDLRNVFNPKGLYLSAMLRVQSQIVEAAYDVKRIAEVVDALLLMTFDMVGFWDGIIGYPGALKGDDDNNLESRVKYFKNLGAPAEKIILGITFSGRSFITERNGEIDDPTLKDVSFAGPFFQLTGFLGYNEICKMRKTRAWDVTFDPEASQALGKFKENGKTNVVTFDTPRSVANKVKFAEEQNLGGVWTWFVDSDDFRGDCPVDPTTFADYQCATPAPRKERDFPLLRTISEAIQLLKGT